MHAISMYTMCVYVCTSLCVLLGVLSLMPVTCAISSSEESDSTSNELEEDTEVVLSIVDAVSTHK